MHERTVNQPKSNLSRRNVLRATTLTVLSFAFGHMSPDLICKKSPNPSARIAIFTDIHIANSDGNTQANKEAPKTLISRTPLIKQIGPFDLVVDIGDGITENPNDRLLNIANETKGFQILSQMGNVRHVPGNHDKWGIPDYQLKQLYRKFGQKDFHFVFPLKDVQIVGIDIIAPPDRHGELEAREIDWLKNVIHPDTPTILFSHYPLYQPNMDGNPYFENAPQGATLQNSNSVWRAIKHLPIWAIISGHTHFYAHKEVDGTHMIIADSFTETDIPHKNQGKFSTLELDGRRLTFNRWTDGIQKSNIIFECKKQTN